MRPTGILGKLNQLGVKIRVDNGQLRFSPRSVVPTDLFNEMRANKMELLALLTESPQSSPPRSSTPPRESTLPFLSVPTVNEGAVTSRETTWLEGQQWVVFPAGEPIEPVFDLASEWDLHKPLYWSFLDGLRHNNRVSVEYLVGRLRGKIRMIHRNAIGLFPETAQW